MAMGKLYFVKLFVPLFFGPDKTIKGFYRISIKVKAPACCIVGNVVKFEEIRAGGTIEAE